MAIKVIIIGAGLAGLGAAIPLLQNGHDVHIFEQSLFLNEIGAAINIAPNASRILRAWGIDLNSLQSVKCKNLRIWDEFASTSVSHLDGDKLREELQIEDEWLLVHRVDAHSCLKETALKGFNGNRPSLYLKSKVLKVDHKLGEITLEDGSEHRADLIIGADGVHSNTVSCITGKPAETLSTGQSCFRFLIPAEKLLENSLTKALVEKSRLLEDINIFHSNERNRRLIMYPCREGQILNCCGIYWTESGAISNDSDWLSSGSKSMLMELYKYFGPELRECCAISEDVKHWTLSTRDPPPTFIAGKLVLIGDAAHPTLPHQGQGASQGLEDAAVLGSLCDDSITTDDLPERLRLYEKIRYERSLTIMIMSRMNNEMRAGMLEKLRSYIPNAEYPENMFSYAWLSRPIDRARDELAGLA